MRASLWVITVLGALLLSFQAYGQMSHIRHHFVMQNGIDPKYESRVSPLKKDAANIATGKKLFEKNCALCHGATGSGDGEAGKSLKPPPANIAMFIRMHNVPDAYLYWTIAEGGVPLKTAMPPFKDSMKENEIWATILYLREL